MNALRSLHQAGCLLLLYSATAAGAAELKPETIKAWDGYIQTVSSRMAERAHAGHFLWLDEAADRIR